MTLEGVDKRSKTGYSEQNIVGLITRKELGAKEARLRVETFGRVRGLVGLNT